jgi:hypothetical protein
VKTRIIGQNPEPAAPAGTQEHAPEASVATSPQAQATATEAQAPPAPEVGGRGGLDPVRYGDWEKNGRCIDF